MSALNDRQRKEFNDRTRAWATRQYASWEPWEDLLLLGLKVKQGGQLVAMSKTLGRTYEACRERLTRLHPENMRGAREEAHEPQHPQCPRCFCQHPGEC